MASAPTATQRMSPVEPRSTGAKPAQTPTEPTERLWEVASGSRSLAEFYAGALQVLVDRFDAPYAAISAQRKSDTINKSVAASESAKPWSKRVDDLRLDARYRSTSIARIVRLDSIERSFAVLATPLCVEGEGVVGSVGLVAAVASKDGAEAKLGELKALTSLISVLAAQVGSGPRKQTATEATDQGEGLQQASRYRTASEYAYSVTNGLKTKLNVAQASLAIVQGRRSQIVCVSGFDRVESQASGIRVIQQALDECVDVGRCVISQAKASRSGADYLLHKAWRSRCDGDAVASIPIEQDGSVVAVIGLQHREGESFDAEHLAKVQEKLAPVIGGLLVLRRSERRLSSHLADSAGEAWKAIRRPGWRRASAAAAIAIAVVWSVVGQQTYVLSSPATLQARDIRQVAAPFAGTITACHVKPGSRVAAGEPILEFDTTPIEAERAQVLGQLTSARATLRQATAAGDLAAAASAHAEATGATSRLSVLDDRLRRAQINAPGNGVVLSGDVEPRVGEAVPLGEPLLELATGDEKRVDVYVDEAASTLIETGQTVSFVANANPSSVLRGSVTQIDASSTVHDSKNAFRATVALEGEAPAWAISGMEGVARIETAPQPIWWVWCHRVVDAIRIQWWKL